MRTPRAGSLAPVFVLLATCASAQAPSDQAVGKLASPDPAVRLEAIAAQLNIFVVGNRTTAQMAFDAGPLALGAARVPPEVLVALRTAARGGLPKVSLEALYAFGALGVQPTGAGRRDLLQASAPDLMAILNLPDPLLRLAAIRVVGRLYEKRAGDAAINQGLGDLVIAAVNERDKAIKLAAMETLGDTRDPRALDGLTQLFQFYGKGDLAEGALAALSRIGHPSSAPLFLTQLASKTPEFRALAIEGLARTGDASHMAAIEVAVKTSEERVIAAGDFAATMLSNAPIEQVVDGLNRPRMHDAARRYLVELAPGHVGRMSRYAQDPDWRRRVDVADIVGLAGDPQGMSILVPMLTDKDKQVALAAERAALRLRTD